MSIPPNTIIDYLTEKFSDWTLVGSEFRTNSLFTEDIKQKMYVNTDTGMWIDFKSGEKGNFYHLVSHIENVPYASAKAFIRRLVFNKGFSILDVSTLSVDNRPIQSSRSIEDDMKEWLPVNPKKDINSPNYLKRAASRFAIERGLQGFKFYVGKTGRYHQRVIIPYTHNDSVFYFQARTLINRDPKYLNPGKDTYGIKTSEILYPYDESMDYVIVTEGPLDAMTLQAAGYNATCTQGCKMSTVQARDIKCKKVIIAYDNDEAGIEGVKEARKRLLSQRREKIYKLVPPNEYKDWNEFWVNAPKNKFCSYVEQNILEANWETSIIERLA